MQSENGISKSIILYPYKQGTNDEFKYENVIFYDVDKVPDVLERIYANENIVENILSCLRTLEKEVLM